MRKENEAEHPPNVQIDVTANTMTITSGDYTLRWAAPEVLAEEEAGTSADIWSFGWVCSEVSISTTSGFAIETHPTLDR